MNCHKSVEKQKYDQNLHQLVCFDIKQIYPSFNITRVVSYILEVIFKNPKSYFTPEKDAKGYILPIPTRAESKVFSKTPLKTLTILTNKSEPLNS
jgi:hypothetical protein